MGRRKLLAPLRERPATQKTTSLSVETLLVMDGTCGSVAAWPRLFHSVWSFSAPVDQCGPRHALGRGLQQVTKAQRLR